MVNKDDCWLWAGYQNKLGYGMYQIKIDGKWRERRAHRLVYENLVGEIPEGLVLDHLCKVTTCVNPEHLEPVTLSENVLRGDAVLTQRSKTHCPSGHAYSGNNLLLRPTMNRGKIYIYRKCRTCTNAAAKALYYRRKNER